MDKIKAIIFDMDGVLIDAREWHYEALNRALSLFGMEISRYDHLVTYDGLPTKKKLEMLSMERGLPTALHGFINRMKQRYTMEIITVKCKPKFYHEYALSRLKSDGYKLAVCSNSIKLTMQEMLTKSNLSKYLEFYLSNEDVKKSKPDPEMYVKAAVGLGLKPTECLIVEDNENGKKAAIASGAFLLQVKHVEEVNYENIIDRVQYIEREKNDKYLGAYCR